MPALLVVLALLLSPAALRAQTISATLPAFNRPASEIVLLNFGMDHPVTIGTVNADGALTVNVAETRLSSLPDSVRSEQLGRLYDNLFFKCDDRSAFGASSDDVAARAPNMFLYRDSTMAGALFAVSDTLLTAWLEDEAYTEPILGSFWEVVYVERDMTVSSTCGSTLTFESGTVNQTLVYDLELKAGLNLVEYAIDAIHKTDPAVMASKPSRVTVRSATDASRIRWVTKHFY